MKSNHYLGTFREMDIIEELIKKVDQVEQSSAEIAHILQNLEQLTKESYLNDCSWINGL
jgi:hypothetical protein